MALGIIKSIPSNTHVQIFVPTGPAFPTITVLNPNDGVLYVAQNRDITNTGFGAWDYKIPSQSYAALPGPWQSVGLFYTDQSGAGRNGEVIIYPVYQTLNFPTFQSIGRSLVAAESTLDVVEGTQPANPGVGIGRLWIDTNDDLHLLNSAGVDTQWVDFETVLGGDLTGFMPNPVIAALAVTAAKLAAGAAATNVGALGGVLSGNLPNPGMAAGAALANIGGGGLTNTYLAAGAALANLATAGFTAFTPTVNQGGFLTISTNVARAIQFGKLCVAYASINILSAGAAGSAVIVGGWPFAFGTSYGNFNPMGVGMIVRSGIQVWIGVADTNNQLNRWMHFYSGTTQSVLGILPNFALANGDAIGVLAAYETT